MKYLCLVYSEPNDLGPQPEILRQSGHFVIAEALQPVETATTIRVRNGKLSITHGPCFMPTRA
jgi:hypothetical protein